MITHLFCDIDGTLTVAGQGLDIQLIKAIEILRRKGIAIGLVTGRDAGFASAFHLMLNMNGPIICENGALLYLNFPKVRDPIIMGKLNESVKKEILSRLPEVPYSRFKKYTITFHPEEGKTVRQTYNKIRRKVSDLNVVVMESTSAIDVNPVGVDKGLTMLKYAELTGSNCANFAYVGDSPNDVPVYRAISEQGGHIAYVGKDKSVIKPFVKACTFVSKKPNTAGTAEFLKYLAKHYRTHTYCSLYNEK